MKLYRTMLATLLCLASSIGRGYADFMPLGDLPGGMFLSRAAGVSADGSTVVGESVSASGFEAFRWTQPGGMLSLGVPSTSATATSATGSVVVGIINGDEAFRWTQAGGIVGLGFLPGDAVSRAFGVSADGSVVVGNSSGIFFQAFRWTTAEGMVGLGFLPGGDLSSALAVSASGAVVVVGASDSTFGRQAFRWTSTNGMIGLGDLPGGSFFSFAHGVSASGSIVVGESDSASGVQAFRWTPTGGMLGLGFLPGDIESAAFAASADGSVIVGRSTIPLEPGRSDLRAFVWDTTNGMRDVRDVLISQGDELTGWKLIEALDISANGTSIVGRGINPAGEEEAWVARLGGAVIPEPSSMALVTAGMLTVLARCLLRRRRVA